MTTRSERIKFLIERSGKTYQELEGITGIKKSSLQRYASGVTAKIPLDVIEKLSKAFNVSQEYLMGWNDLPKLNLQLFTEGSPSEPPLTEGEKMWLELYHQISADTRDILIKMMISFDRLPEDRQKFALEAIRIALGDH